LGESCLFCTNRYYITFPEFTFQVNSLITLRPLFNYDPNNMFQYF